MPIISKETWDKFTQEEQHKLKSLYRENEEFGCAENNIDLERIFPKDCLKSQPLTYEDVARELFGDKKFMTVECHFTSHKQAEKLLAINKLLNVAKFLNKDWKPDWSDKEEKKFFPSLINNEIRIGYVMSDDSSIVYFRTEELVKRAVDILVEDTVRLALTTEY